MDHIASLLFRILGETVLAGVCIFIGTSTSRNLFADNARYRQWCRDHIAGKGDSISAALKRRQEDHRRERQVVTIFLAFVVTAITVAHVLIDGRALINDPRQEEVRLAGLVAAWCIAMLGVPGSLFDLGMYIVRRRNFRREYYAQEQEDRGWWYDRNWTSYNAKQLLHVNRGLVLFIVGWAGLLAALQLTFNIAGK